MTSVPVITLNNGVTIPQLGFGVYQVPPEQTREATLAALQIGYRHIDTAEMYRNERGVGEAVRESGLAREDVFVTSKLNNPYQTRDDALAAFERTLAELDLGYLDLFLIHWPLPTVRDYVETWRVMEEILTGGRVRAIGVSNFEPAHLDRLAAETDTVPAINQIEAHPYLTNDVVRGYNQAHGIATEAWAPIAKGKVAEDPVIKGIAERVARTPAQVTLRWHLQRGDIVFPKSITRSRVEENFALFDFELSDADVAAISALNTDARIGPHPDVMDRVTT
ncbi:aldo/keto reductase [Microlunatus sp. GCM10028923]|uniref:aldo/keto reductase n=1 Tax=Microlunatus sp. GCM10028923 TaxID=3273400 RepID=UPI00361EF541